MTSNKKKRKPNFSVGDANRPPDVKLWAPLYNKQCGDLLQAKCDELEAQGVLINPKQYNINVWLSVTLLYYTEAYIQKQIFSKLCLT